ncbi:MAG TPA: DMT family transporter [Mycobacteriales bacterium]|nr:DMT family transporter [Mycobacteriales bacterium]
MLTYLFATLAGGANAVSSVLQRKAHRDAPTSATLSWQLLAVLRTPIWLFGFLGVIAGFLLQAAALSQGPLTVVEPILVIELPLTLLLAGVLFQRRLNRREWIAALVMAAGLAGLLYSLSPTAAAGAHVDALGWWIGIPLNVALVAALVAQAQRGSSARKAALLGVATGGMFGLTVALMKSMTNALTEDGVAAIFTTWQTYGMVASGGVAMFLLQSALNAGSLVAAQPGFTITDPVVSVLWGVFGYGDTVRSGVFLLLAALFTAAIAAGALSLAHSPLVIGDAEVRVG